MKRISPKGKIAKVLQKIKDESEINPNKQWVEFKFYPDVVSVGSESVRDDEEKRILLKLEGEKILKLHLPEGRDQAEEGFLSGYTPSEFMMRENCISIWMEVLPKFNFKHWQYQFYAKDFNRWNFVNIFWLLWQIVVFGWKILKFVWKHKVISLFIALVTGSLGLLALDYSVVGKNVDILLKFISEEK